MGSLAGGVQATGFRTNENLPECEGSGEGARGIAAATVLVEAAGGGAEETTGANQTEDPVEQRIRELEQEVRELKGVLGQKTLEVDFFAEALRRVEESRQRKGKSGVTASSPESAGGCKRKVD